MSTSHIRPKVRKPSKKAKAAVEKTAAATEQDVEEVRQKIENWMGIGGDEPKKPNASETMFPSTINIPSSAMDTKAESKVVPPPAAAVSTPTLVEGHGSIHDTKREKPQTPPKSILKKPKYSKPKDATSTPLEATEEPQPEEPKKSIFKQDCIRERDPTVISSHSTKIQLNPKEAASAAMAVEGYQPRMDHNKRIGKKEPQNNSSSNKNKKDDSKNDDEPLVFNSLADMMEMAGILPSQDLTNDPQVVEADLSFTCMAPDDYKTGLILQGMEQQEKESQANEDTTPEWRKPLSNTTPNIINSDDGEGYTGTNPISDEDEEGTYDDDDGSEIDNVFFDLLGGGDDDDEESDSEPAPPRTFRVLWECLSPLITPDSCAFLRRLKREQESSGSGTTGSSYLITTTHLTDLETSRSNGFMAMLRMYMTRSLKELDQPMEMRRTAEQRLQGLLCTFNFSRPAAKLDTKQWKALTCILLEMVLFLNQYCASGSAAEGNADAPLPASPTAADITSDEYRYLVHNTIQTFDIPDPVI